MALDKAVVDAILSETAAAGQPKELAERMVRWLEDISDGRVGIQDLGENKRRIETILDRVTTLEGDSTEEPEGRP